MVHQMMVGITELALDNDFQNWILDLDEKILAQLTTFELYQQYLSDTAKSD